MEYVNLTPHDIQLNDGTCYKASGIVARVFTTFSKFDENKIAKIIFGEIENLPSPKTNTIYIVSSLVAQAVKGREDVVSPATGHPGAIRSNGNIISVPGFVRIN